MASKAKTAKVKKVVKKAEKPDKEVKAAKESEAAKKAKVEIQPEIKEVKPEPKAEVKEVQPKPKSSSPAPKTMEELLSSSEYSVNVPKKGEIITGIITGISKKSVTVDIGAKTEGIVVDKEFEAAREYIDTELKEGQEVEAIVASSESNSGQILLSLRRAAADSRWEYFEEAFKKETILEAKGFDVNKGGLIAVVNGTRGFVPSSQFGKELVGNYQALTGQTIKVKVIEVDREKNRLIFSERHVSEAQEIAQKEKALESVEVDSIYEGVVSGVMHFGLFVTVEIPVQGSDVSGLVEGLVHISEISWEKVSHPKDYHQVGDRIKVRVLGIDEKTGKLNLSIKQLSDDPWLGIDEKYQQGMTISGTVSRIESFGVFVNVEEGVDGLIHSSKLDPSVELEKGQEITVFVESVDPDQRRMSLSVVLTELPVGYK